MKDKKCIKNKCLAFSLVFVLLMGLFPVKANAAGPGGYRPGGGNNSGTSNTSIDHIDIGVDLTATVIINGVEQQAEFTINTSDARYVTITADPADTNFSLSGDVSTSTDNQGKKQIRIEGDFPVGSESKPVSYTVTLSKTITTNDGYDVPVTLSATMHYWDGGNVCPGFQQKPGNMSGIDLVLNNGTGSSVTKGNIQIQKTIEGAELSEDKTFRFRLLDVSGNVYRDNIALTVPAGHAMASIILTNVDLGTYTVEEISPIEEISGCKLNSTEYTNNGVTTISTEDNSSIINVTSTYQKIQLAKHTISFTNHDGQVISQTIYDEGSEIVIPNNPTRPADKRYTYTFKGWDKQVSATAVESVTYEAVYEAEYVNYEIQFKNWDGSELLSSTYHYEDQVTLPAEPTRPADKNFTYVFKEYVPAVGTVTDNQVYTATYDTVPIVPEYTITFEDYDGSVIDETVYPEGSKITIPKSPERASDKIDVYAWVFVGWDKEVAKIATQNAIYTAVYEKQYIDYIISFIDWDNSEIVSDTYHYGELPVAPEDPVRAADKENTYTFVGWDKKIITVTGNTVYQAVYEATPIIPEYTIIFEDYDGTVISETIYPEGSEITAPEKPERVSDEPKVFTWVFAGWDKIVAEIATENVTYTAVYEKQYINYIVSFVNWDNSELTSGTYHYGEMPVAPETEPTKPADDEYTYTFRGYEPEIGSVTGDQVYKAVFTSLPIPKKHVIAFTDYDGKVINKTIYDDGNKVIIPDSPTRPADKRYTYTFKGWNKQVSTTAVESVTYEAVYEAEYINYQIKFENWDGSELLSSTYHYEDQVTLPAEPTKPADEKFTYVFKTYVPAVGTVSDNQVYTAVYDAIPIIPEYTIVFKDYDGSVISETIYPEDSEITVPGSPERATDEPKAFTWVFVGWDKKVAEIATQDVTYKAVYQKQYIDYTISFIDWDNSELKSDTYHYGEVPVAPEDPARVADTEYTYTFSNWDKEVVPVTGNTVYRAVYHSSPIPKKYTVTFNDYDGSEINTTIYPESSEIILPEAPKRVSDEPKAFTWVFVGWDKEVAEIATQDVTYKAVYQKQYIDYQIQFKNWDGSELLSNTYHYEDQVTLPAEPTKPADEKFTYVFKTYVPAVETVTGDQVYTATYDAIPIVPEYTITFEDYDSSVISETVYPEDSEIILPESPERATDEPGVYAWVFVGWDKEVAEIATENVTYTAVYEKQYIDYIISFIDWDNSEIVSDTYHYGELPVTPEDPARAADTEYTYTFSNWDKEIVPVTGNTVYQAVYELTEKTVSEREENEEISNPDLETEETQTEYITETITESESIKNVPNNVPSCGDTSPIGLLMSLILMSGVPLVIQTLKSTKFHNEN